MSSEGAEPMNYFDFKSTLVVPGVMTHLDYVGKIHGEHGRVRTVLPAIARLRPFLKPEVMNPHLRLPLICQ